MKKLALAGLVGGVGVALAGCGSSGRPLVVALNRKDVAVGSLVGDRFLSPTRLVIVTSGTSSCPAVPDRLMVEGPDTIRIHLTEGSWRPTGDSHRTVLVAHPPPNQVCTTNVTTTPMVVTVNPKQINVHRPLTIRLYYYGLTKPVTNTAPAL